MKGEERERERDQSIPAAPGLRETIPEAPGVHELAEETTAVHSAPDEHIGEI